MESVGELCGREVLKIESRLCGHSEVFVSVAADTDLRVIANEAAERPVGQGFCLPFALCRSAQRLDDARRDVERGIHEPYLADACEADVVELEHDRATVEREEGFAVLAGFQREILDLERAWRGDSTAPISAVAPGKAFSMPHFAMDGRRASRMRKAAATATAQSSKKTESRRIQVRRRLRRRGDLELEESVGKSG